VLDGVYLGNDDVLDEANDSNEERIREHVLHSAREVESRGRGFHESPRHRPENGNTESIVELRKVRYQQGYNDDDNGLRKDANLGELGFRPLHHKEHPNADCCDAECYPIRFAQVLPPRPRFVPTVLFGTRQTKERLELLHEDGKRHGVHESSQQGARENVVQEANAEQAKSKKEDANEEGEDGSKLLRRPLLVV